MNILFLNDDGKSDIRITYAEYLSEVLGKTLLTATTIEGSYDDYISEQSIDILCISCDSSRKTLQRFLNKCRTIRIPYLFLTDIQQPALPIHRILMPVSMLEEEVYKGQICSHLARATAAATTLLQAKDYGSRAMHNTQKIAALLDKFALQYQVLPAKTDSFHITAECCDRLRELRADMVIVTASRDYGLDDLFFGPPERKVLQRSQVPVMLVNPRDDLFSLCD